MCHLALVYNSYTMARQRTVNDLTIEELRHLIIEKRRTERQARLANFRRTGRVIAVEPQPTPAHLEDLRHTPLEIEKDVLVNPIKPRRRIWLDRLLLLVEVGAVLGLILILISGFNLLRTLNQEVSSALVQPTLAPTPLIMAVVLPSGHTPPNSPGGVQPNTAEIPEHLRPLVQSLADLPLPTPGPEQAIRIQIPAIGVDAPVVQGDGWEQLKKGVGQHVGTPNPGESGNIVFSAHNDVFGEIFRYLEKLKKGDQVILFTSQRKFTYTINQNMVVEPTQVEWLSQTQEAVVTLISCYPYLVDDQRIVVTARLQENP